MRKLNILYTQSPDAAILSLCRFTFGTCHIYSIKSGLVKVHNLPMSQPRPMYDLSTVVVRAPIALKFLIS